LRKVEAEGENFNFGQACFSSNAEITNVNVVKILAQIERERRERKRETA